ncbi:hypothetical protein RRF57_001574 [Xylaria bambusicola]|uniref:Uncharacterized protein n=1 Tax=Xylaria bambusicola TaxID=326684 RepID=A0AAN7UC78_9PEZI
MANIGVQTNPNINPNMLARQQQRQEAAMLQQAQMYMNSVPIPVMENLTPAQYQQFLTQRKQEKAMLQGVQMQVNAVTGPVPRSLVFLSKEFGDKLEEAFQENPKPSRSVKAQLAASLCVEQLGINVGSPLLAVIRCKLTSYIRIGSKFAARGRRRKST